MSRILYMDYIQGACREQGFLLPERLEDYVDDENPVRFIDAFVDSLDVEELGFTHGGPRIGPGRPPYHAKDLLKLYLYGYLNRVRSSRRLEAETHRNLEVLWLMKKLHPDHKTIADFRRVHGPALKKVFREFHLLCHKLQLFGRLVAIDGSVFKAVNSKSKNVSQDRLRKRIGRIDERIEDYLKMLEGQDDEESGSPGCSTAGLTEKLAGLKEQRETCRALLESLEEAGETQRSLTDADSRMLKKNGKSEVGYNVQLAVEAQEKLIVSEEVTLAGNDSQQLEPMSEKAADQLDADPGESPSENLQVVVDQGYENYEQIVNCEQAGREVYIPLKPEKAAEEGRFTLEEFLYDAGADAMICPAGKRLERKGDSTRKAGLVYRTYYDSSVCRGCVLLSRCTKGKYRKINLNQHHEIIERVRTRLKSHPEVYEQRKSVIEHIFGSLKHWMNQGSFLCKGREQVAAEFTLSCLAYNMKRVLGMYKVPELIRVITAR